jgi:hypothetical protein
VGETRVDLLHLLEDLRDAYPGPAEETVLTEIVGNALDSGATAIAIHTDPVQRTFMLIDDGAGMKRRELSRYPPWDRRGLARRHDRQNPGQAYQLDAGAQ